MENDHLDSEKNFLNLFNAIWRQSVGKFLVSSPRSKFKVDQKVYKKNIVKFFNQIQSSEIKL